MLFDTDILIWVQKGNLKAARLLERTTERCLSLQSFLELMQLAENREQQKLTRNFLNEYQFQVIPLTENIGHRAAVYIEQFSLSGGLRAGDAIIAATAVERNLTLCSSNYRHFKAIPDLEFRRFNP